MKTIKTLSAAALALAACVATVPAQAGAMKNAPYFNAPYFNAPYFNAPYFNAPYFNAPYFNALSLNALSLNGTTLPAQAGQAVAVTLPEGVAR